MVFILFHPRGRIKTWEDSSEMFVSYKSMKNSVVVALKS
jgi:hypothetical protein